MENKQGYDPSEFEEDDYMTPQPDQNSIRGYRIVIIILSVILVALSALCCRPTATRSRATWDG